MQLPETAPDFDQPLAVLKHCHGRIRKQLETLERLHAHLQTNGANLDAKQGAQAILRYFEQAAPLHHADEEVDLFPRLAQSMTGDSEADVLLDTMHRLRQEHQHMDALWTQLQKRLQAIIERESDELELDLVGNFCRSYREHMTLEESLIAPAALRLFSAEQMSALGQAMRARRGILQS